MTKMLQPLTQFAPMQLPKNLIPSYDLQALFDLCNERYFDGAVQPSPGFVLRFSRAVKLFGSFSYSLESHVDWEIAIASRLREHPLAALNTMVHEMLHMLAHQRFRETGDEFYLDEHELPGRPFVNKGHGAFFVDEMERLNRMWPELKIDVKSEFGDGLYEQDRIKPVRLLLVTVEKAIGRGMIYRLHENARINWKAFRETASRMHGDIIDEIQLVEVPGQLGEGFPVLKKNNEPRARMVPVGLKGYAEKSAALLSAAGVRLIPEPATVTRLAPRPVATTSVPAKPGQKTGTGAASVA